MQNGYVSLPNQLTLSCRYCTGAAQTIGIQSSVGVEGKLFEVIGVKADLSLSADYSITSSVGVTVRIGCNPGQQSNLYWTPVFNRYQGTFKPGGESFDVAVPVEDSAGSFNVECLG